MATDLRQGLILAARQFYHQGWMVGTAGNLSAKLPNNSFWITASGKQKGKLTEMDFLRLSPQGELLETPNPANRPSAETSIHQGIYSLFPEAQVCYHVHSIEANLVSNLFPGDHIPLPPLEMVKGFGIWEEQPQATMALFQNHLEVSQIAADILERFQQFPPQIPALLIRNHGVTVWGKSGSEAENLVELSEYIFRYLVAAHSLKLF
ncbi:MAG: methylthioribulose 1-phosphate dehydratase [Oscillatoriales cyanobacterium RM2_1_1]|nr:methylthioribulose 1-phosphate dehydratase [Oscillatoriales cyanobacterium SM2_3_0]NJO46249.1 methylthioribulose 1-phosphate dehydratase [Oscillatoriales cyanobacterium RM2_1_1]